MKLLYVFFILIVGAFAHPTKRDVNTVSLPFMAIVRITYDNHIDIDKWAIILTEKWLLSSLNISEFTNVEITAQVYTDLFTKRRYEYEVKSTRVLKTRNPDLYPSFSLFELQSSINFGDSRKPVPLAGPNYEWQENEEAYYVNFNLDEKLPEIEYFQQLPIKVTTNEKRYESDMSACLESEISDVLNELECDPVILNGTLIGFHIRTECERQPFLKLSSIYEQILSNIPQLDDTEYQLLMKENIITLPEKLKWKSFVLQSLFGNQEPKILNILNFNNVSFNLNFNGEREY